jgi:hypothetical protein
VYLLMLLPLAFPFACLVLLISIAFLGVVVLDGALHVIGTARSLVRIAAPIGAANAARARLGGSQPGFC